MFDSEDKAPACPWSRRHWKKRGSIMEEQDGYSGMFYIMLIVGIVGVLGFVLVAAGAGS